jgi:hypothetical protein
MNSNDSKYANAEPQELDFDSIHWSEVADWHDQQHEDKAAERSSRSPFHYSEDPCDVEDFIREFL